MMSAFVLKIVAIIAMTIDHVGYVFFPDVTILRVIGRLTMPIMSFLVAEGIRKTRDIQAYMNRILLFAVITVLPFLLVFKWAQNVMFTFWIAVLAIRLSKRYSPWLCIGTAAIAATILGCDWGFAGIIMTYGFYRAENDKFRILQTLMFTAVVAFMFFYGIGTVERNLFQLGIFLSIPFLYMYNGQRGIGLKYLFYIYYPLHLLVIYYFILLG